MANPWVLLAICWYLQHSIALAQTSRASLAIVSSDLSAQSTSRTLLRSAVSASPEHSSIGSALMGNSAKSSTKTNEESSTTTAKEILLSGTYYHEIHSPTASLSGLNGTARHVPTSTLTDLNGTKTALPPHRPTNTQPCNLYVEFCGRSYGNITYVGAHNSPFARENNAAANQHLDTTTQLNDGIRMRMYSPGDQ